MKDISEVTTCVPGYDSSFLDALNIHRHLEWFDGPLLTEKRTPEYPSSSFLYHWCDCDDRFHRWLLFTVSTENLQTYLDGKICLRTLFSKTYFEEIHIVDMNEDECKIGACKFDQIPEQYLPPYNCFYNADS